MKNKFDINKIYTYILDNIQTMPTYDNYIEEYVYGLPGVEDRRSFNTQGESENQFTYGNITSALESRNKNKAKDKNSDRLKEIHRKAIKMRDTSTTVGQIWVEMDQDDERMNRYLFPDRTNNLINDETNIRDLTAEINATITRVNTNVAAGTNVSAEDQKVIDLIELFTTKTIAPSGKKWTLYGTDKPLYGCEIESIDLTEDDATPTFGSIIYQINDAVGSGNYDDASNRSFTGFTLPTTTPKASLWTDGIETSRKIGLSSTKLNIYSYVKITTNNTTTTNTYDYYYIPTEANYTTNVAEDSTNFIYYHQLYPRYHIVDSVVNNMSHSNAYQYEADGTGAIDTAKLGKKYILNVGESTTSDIPTKIDGTNQITFEYGDYYKVGRTVWMVSRSTDEHNKYLKDHQTEVRNIRLNAIKTKDSLQTKPGQIWVKMNKNDTRNSKYFYPEITPIKWTDTGSPVRPTVGRDLSNVLSINAQTELLLSYVNDTYKAIPGLDGKIYYSDNNFVNYNWEQVEATDTSYTAGDFYVTIDSINYKLIYSTDVPDIQDNITKAADISHVPNIDLINGATQVLPTFITLIKDFKFNYDDYILNTTGNNYWTINYDESRKLAGDTVSSKVANFFKDNTIINDGSVDTSYILNSKTDFNTQNILMDSKLVKQYGDTYVLLDNTDIPANIKYGDYYDENSNILFGYKWVLTNQTKKLDYGRELYDSDLTQMLRSLLPTTIASVSALSYKAIESTTYGTWYLTTDDGNNWTEVAETNFTSYTSGDTLIQYTSNNYTVFTNDAIKDALYTVNDANYTILTDTQKDTIANINRKIELIPSNLNIVFTQTDLDNLNIKSLDYIYVARADDVEDIYYKAIENNDGVFDGKHWKLIAKGDRPNFGRELYHQNLSDLLTGPTGDIVTLDEATYNDNNLSKLNLQTSDYILGADNSTAYRPMPIYIWLATRSTENQHVYDKHHQITINDTKNEALNIKQSSDVPGQIWKKMNKDDAKNSGLYYTIITPLHWETTDNGATRPEKGRDLSGILTPTQLAELVAYVDTGTFNLDTFNDETKYVDIGGIKDFEFYYDDYVLNTSSTTTPNKYYTIDYKESRKLNDARLNNHTSKTDNELRNFLLDNNFEGYKENYNYPFDKYYANIINSTRDSKTNRIIVYGDEYVLLDHRDVPNRVMDGGNPVVKDNNIKYGDFYENGSDIWLAVRSNDVQYAFNNTVDTDIKEIRNTAKDVRRTADNVGQIWVKMLENDKRMSKYNFQNMIDGNSRPYYVWKSIDKIGTPGSGYWITKDNGLTWNTVPNHDPLESVLVTNENMKAHLVTEIEDPSIVITNSTLLENFRINTMQPIEKFLKYNIDIYDNSLQKSYIVDSLVDSKTNRITKYGNEYIIFDNHLIPNQGDTKYGQYYLPEDFVFGTKWSLIGTQKPRSGRLLIINDIASSLDGSNSVTITTTNIHEIRNGINISIQDSLNELELTPDDYIESSVVGSYYRAVAPYRWLVSRSDDEEYHYKKVRDIRLKDVLHEAEKVRQSSTRIGQIWTLMSPGDERISLNKFPDRRSISNTIVTGNFKTLLDDFNKKASIKDISSNPIYQKEFIVDGITYSKNTYSVVDSIIDKNTYEITYDNDIDDRSGLGSTLVLLDTRDVPNLNVLDGDTDGITLRYGDYYEKNASEWIVVTRSNDVQHAKDDYDTTIKDAERAEHKSNEQSALQNDYQFSTVDDRIGRLWQEVTDLPILASNKKLIEHNATETLLDGGTIELSREELNTLLSDFTFTKILSTKYIQHRTKNNSFYVTTDNGSNWIDVVVKPVVGTQVYHDDTSKILEANDLVLTSEQLDALTTAIDSDFVVGGSDNHNDWYEHNKRNRYYTTQYLKDGTDYFISNDYGYNWVKVTAGAITNRGTSLSTVKMGYEIVHQPTLDILKLGRLLLTSSELDDLLNMAKYASAHYVIQNSGDSESLLAGEYVSHRLLTRYHYLKSASKYYIPGKYINEDYKNYISFPGKGKLGRYWKLREIRNFTDFTEITASAVVYGGDSEDADTKLANFTKFMNILEGNDGSYDSDGDLVTPDPERDSNLEPRLVLTQVERDTIFGSTTIVGTTENGTHYVQHRVNSLSNSNIPNVHYISQDNGITWQKLTQVSDVSVEIPNDPITDKKMFNNINETLGEKIKDISVANSTDGILNLDFEDFVNYDVEDNIRENSYIVEDIYVYVPGQYVNEEYIYYPSAHEYPSKNDLGRIWMNIGTTDPTNINGNASAINPSNSGLEELLLSFKSANNNITKVTIGGTDYDIFSISYQEYANNNVNNMSELNYVLTPDGNYYIPGRYINDYNDYYPLAPSS